MWWCHSWEPAGACSEEATLVEGLARTLGVALLHRPLSTVLDLSCQRMTRSRYSTVRSFWSRRYRDTRHPRAAHAHRGPRLGVDSVRVTVTVFNLRSPPSRLDRRPSTGNLKSVAWPHPDAGPSRARRLGCGMASGAAGAATAPAPARRRTGRGPSHRAQPCHNPVESRVTAGPLL